MKEIYTQEELSKLLAQVEPRSGWDFSRMNTLRQPVPWEYEDEVRRYLKATDFVLDIGTGGGERFTQMAGSYARGLGVNVPTRCATRGTFD